MPTYASKTVVTPQKSREELEKTLKRYGAKEFAYMSSEAAAIVAFTAHNRTIRFTLPMPDPDSPDITHTETGLRRSELQREAARGQAERQAWRALVLVVKAKLEAVESGIVSFEQEFYSHVVLPGGQTLYEATHEQVNDALTSGTPLTLRLSIEA